METEDVNKAHTALMEAAARLRDAVAEVQPGPAQTSLTAGAEALMRIGAALLLLESRKYDDA